MLIRRKILLNLYMNKCSTDKTEDRDEYVRLKKGLLSMSDLGGYYVYFGRIRNIDGIPVKVRRGFISEFQYLVPLLTLGRLGCFRFPWVYHRLDEHTLAKKTIFGGLVLRRVLSEGSRDGVCGVDDSKFSKRDYKIIEKNLDELIKDYSPN